MASSAIPSATSTVQPSRAPSPKVSTTTTTPLTHIAHLASVHSSVLALFDTGKLAGFPLPNPSGRTSAQVWELQSRLGAGSSLAGYLRQAQGESASALISGPTLPLLLPSLAELPEPTAKGGRLVIHLALALPAADRPLDGPTSSLAQITALLPVIPESFAVIFSGSADEIVRNAHAIYEDEALQSSHVIHIIEGVSAGRELIRSPSTVASTKGFSVLEAFTYTGSNTATKVFVVPSSYTSTLLRTSGLPADVGVLTINALGPWPTSTLVEALPNAGKAVTELVVIEEASEAGQGTAVLKELVIGAVFGRAGTSSGKVPKITSIAIKGGEVTLERLRSSLGLSKPAEDKSSAKQTVLYTPAASLLPRLLAKTFLSSAALETRLATVTSSIPTLDQSTLVIAPSRGIPSVKPFAATPVEGSSSLIVISTLNALTQTKSALASLAHGGSVLISLPGWDKASTAENLSVQDRKFLADKAARVFVVPSTGTGGEGEETALGLVAFFLLYAGVGEGGKLPEPVRAVVEAALGGVKDVIAQAEAALAEIDTLAFSTAGEGEEPVEEKRAELVLDGLTSFPSVAPSSAQDNANKPLKATWHNPALHLIFKEAFSSVTPTADAPPSVAALMPSQHDKTYLATVTENRRLTPASYDRNVFHLEISTAGTGLTYAVGEALGVHGWNDEQEVRDFLAWYGVDPSDVISVRLPSGAVETRTALQMFQQQVDLFGRPPKSFYAALVGKTSDREERRTLRFISAPEGSSMFKKWSEVETVTYADVLQRFPGLKEHLAIEDLVSLIGEIHPRHYSISSAQKFVGDSVHLLVVTVEWDGVSGKPRYGQCTRYLAGLRPGQQVTVSIKPSVMKLPPLDTQPIIMAGLGTGAAPFRAFIQHRAWQKSQGIEVGPLVYYFGSRYSSQEYLYGEEIEAYLRGGVLTHAGLAFSRDTSAKVYIQHKMLEDGALLSSLLTAPEEKDKGYFYLCGPTWPVPDVYEALVGSIDGSKGVGRERAEAMIEEFKEAERYVLEVY